MSNEFAVDDNILVFLGACILAGTQGGGLRDNPTGLVEETVKYADVAAKFLEAAKRSGCPACGVKPPRLDAKFCVKCGTELNEQEAEAVAR